MFPHSFSESISNFPIAAAVFARSAKDTENGTLSMFDDLVPEKSLSTNITPKHKDIIAAVIVAVCTA